MDATVHLAHPLPRNTYLHAIGGRSSSSGISSSSSSTTKPSNISSSSSSYSISDSTSSSEDSAIPKISPNIRDSDMSHENDVRVNDVTSANSTKLVVFYHDWFGYGWIEDTEIGGQ